MNITFKNIIKEVLKQMSYTPEETEKHRIVLGTIIDTTLSKPTLDVNTFLDPVYHEDQYKWFRDNPSEYIDAYSDEEDEFDKEKSYGPIRDPKETTLLYYLYKGTYKGEDGKWYIGNGQNIDSVIKEVRDRAMAFVDAIGDYQELVDVFYSDYKKVLDFTEKFSEKDEKSTAVSTFMSKGAPGEFERMQFAKFRSGALYGDTTTKGIRGTRDHMYKNSVELKNIPEEHKKFFSFDYMWLTCNNLAQADGLKPSGKKVSELTAELYADNYRNGLTVQERKNTFGTGWMTKLEMGSDLPFITNILLNSLLNDDAIIQPNTKPLSKMSNDEILDSFAQPFDDVLNLSKQALQVGSYPSGIINLLKIKEKIPDVLIKNKARKFNRTLKGLELAGYLTPDGELTDKVKGDKPKKTIFRNLEDFEFIVKQVSDEINSGLVSDSILKKMREKYASLNPEDHQKALGILKKYNVNTDSIEQSKYKKTKNTEEVNSILYGILINSSSSGDSDQKQYEKIFKIMQNSSEEEKEAIIKLIKYYKKRGAM